MDAMTAESTKNNTNIHTTHATEQAIEERYIEEEGLTDEQIQEFMANLRGIGDDKIGGRTVENTEGIKIRTVFVTSMAIRKAAGIPITEEDLQTEWTKLTDMRDEAVPRKYGWAIRQYKELQSNK